MRITHLTIVILLFASTTLSSQLDAFIEGPSEVCLGDCAEYQLFSVNGQVLDAHWSIVSLDPDPGSGCVDILNNTPNLEVCFCREGVYLVQLSNSQDTFFVDPFIVTVQPADQTISIGGDMCTDFDPDNQRPVCSTYCEGSIGIFSIDSLFNAEVEWSVTGGDIIQSTPSEIIVQWTETGQHFVSAFGFAGSCTFETSECVQVIGAAEAQITSDPPFVNGSVTLCRNESIELSSSGSNVAESRWILSNGFSTSGSEITTSFTSSGTFEVLLITDNGCSCGDTAKFNIEVLEDLAPTLDCVGTVCEGTAVTYTAQADCNQFEWTVSTNGQILEGGSISDDFITVRWDAGPEGTISLLSSDCGTSACSRPVDFRIPIISPNADIRGDDRVCPGEISTYVAPSWDGVYYQWNISDRGNILSGQGTPELTVLWNANGSLPDADQFVEVSYNGCYLDCGGSARIDVAVRTDFEISSPISACPGEDVFYQAQTIYAPIQDIACDWELFDNAGNLVATESNTNLVQFSAPAIPGIYTVIATPINPISFCTERREQLLRVNETPPRPASIIGSDTICPANISSFEVDVIDGAMAIWEVVDGSTVETYEGRKIFHSFSQNPPHLISVLFERNGCFSDPVTMDLVLFEPHEIVGQDLACTGNTEEYTTESSDIANFNWIVTPPESGSILSGQGTNRIEILWLEPGQANVILNSCGASSTFNVEVNGTPEIQLTYDDSLCVGESTPVSLSGNFSSYSWKDFSGNEIGIDPTIDLEPGAYRIEITNNEGCSAKENLRIFPLQGPQAVISTPDSKGFCATDPDRRLYANDTEDGLSFQWYYEGNPIAGQTSEELITGDYGNYQILATNDDGCSSWSNIITLFEHCEPRQTPGGAICNLPFNNCPQNIELIFNVIPSTQCNELSFRTNSVGVIPGSQTWFFENYDNFNYDEIQEESPTHTFAEAGYYDVILFCLIELPGPDTCFYHTNQIVTIPVAADFSFQEACPGSQVNFENKSTFVPGEDIASVIWDFGDPGSGPDNTSTNYNAQHIYDSPGEYTVTLTITAQSGCTATTSRSITIPESPANGFDIAENGCPGLSLSLIADNAANFLRWIIEEPGGQTDTFTRESQPFVFADIGTYTILLQSENITGCIADSSLSIDIEPIMADRELIYSLPDPLCDGNSFTLEAPSGGVSWLWNTGSQSSATLVANSGVYWVSIESPEGCRYNSDTLEVSFDPIPESSLGAYLNDNSPNLRDGPYFDTVNICLDQSVTIESLFSDNYSVIWNTGNTGQTQTFDPLNGTGLSLGAHTFYADLLDPITQCTGRTDSITVVVHPRPTRPILNSIPAGPHCEGDQIDIAVSNPESDVAYVWNTGEKGTSISASAAGDYYVTALNPFGCSTESAPIIISKAPDKRWVPAGCLERCRPDTICIPSFDPTVQIQWFMDGNPIAGATSNEYIATEDGTYQALLTNDAGCQNLSDPLSLMLFDGFGDIAINVWRDVDGDEMISAGDTLVEYTEVVLNQAGSEWERTASSPDLTHYFVHQPQGDYVALFDSTTLRPEDEIIVGMDSISIIGCDRMFEGGLLLGTGCPVDSLDYRVRVYFDLDQDGTFGPGDSLATDFDLLINDGTSMLTVQTDGSGIFNYLTEGSPVTILPDTSGLSQSFIINNSGDSLDFDCRKEFFNSIGLQFACTPVAEAIERMICPGDSVLIQSQWISAAGDYTFQYQTVEGCDSTLQYKIRISNQLPSGVPGMIEMVPGEPITLFSGLGQSGISFQWSPAASVDCPTCPVVTLTSDTITDLALTISDSLGCAADYVFTLSIISTNQVFIPNAFSPDGDGINDHFRIYPSEPLTVDRMMIFNRWGDKVFEARGASPEDAKWDGRFNGKPMNPAVFGYWIEVTFLNGEKGSFKGDLTLIR